MGGLVVRREAARLLGAVILHHQPLDDLLDQSVTDGPLSGLDSRDRALARAIVSMSLRRKGQVDDILRRFLRKPLPARQESAYMVLLAAATQILFMRVPPHAAIDTAVTVVGSARSTQHLKGLVNAVLRRVAADGPALLAAQDAPRLNTPDWMWKRWISAYGADRARAIAAAHLEEPALDLTPRNGDAEALAARLGGLLLPTGSVRLTTHHGRIDELAGFAEGEWWVQDAAAAMPARLLGNVAGKTVVDLCAAPGGKTLQLAAAGARVIAVDVSAARLRRLEENLERTGLEARLVCADATAWTPDHPVDAILLDAPCSATGTIRRHPDIPFLKTREQIAALSDLQRRMLDHAASIVRPGGTIIYCTCSLEPEEGEAAIAAALEGSDRLVRSPITPAELGGLAEAITPQGELRTLPSLTMDLGEAGTVSGLDGFFACRLERRG